MTEITVTTIMSGDKFVQEYHYNMTETTVGSNISDTELVQEYYHERRDAKQPAVWICAVLLVIGLVGNSLVFCVFSCHYKKGTYRYFVLFLTLGDLLCCFTAIPLEIISHVYAYPLPYICESKTFFQQFTMYTKLACMTFIVIDVHGKVRYPFGWQLRQKTAVMACICAYIVAALLVLPNPLLWKTYEKEVEYKSRNITVTTCDTYLSKEPTDTPHRNLYFVYNIVILYFDLAFLYSFSVYIIKCLKVWERKVDQLSLKKKLDAHDTEIDTSTFMGDPIAEYVSNNQEPYIMSESEQNHVAAEEPDHLNNRRVEEELDIIYWVRPKALTVIMLSLMMLCIITLSLFLFPAKETYGIVQSLAFINHVVNPVVYIRLDPEYREGRRHLMTNVLKRCCVF